MPDQNRLEVLETTFSIAQKVVVIVAALISGWFILLRGDNTHHTTVSLEAEIPRDCLLVVEVKIENPKGQILAPNTITAQVYRPNFSEEIDSSGKLLAEQIRSKIGSIKIGENIDTVFYVPLDAHIAEAMTSEKVTELPQDLSLLTVRAEVALPGSVVYSAQTYVETTSCAF